MPIRLSPISRRQFLLRSLIAGSGLALRPALLAAQKPVDPDSWALLADTHLAADRALKARGINMSEHFVSVSREVLDLPKRPGTVLIAGDCAYNSGETGDYTVVADLLQPLRAARIPIYLTLGNHDNRERFWQAFEQEKSAKRPLIDKQAGMLKGRYLNWFILDSLEKTSSTPGWLGHEQLDWLARALDANRKAPAIVLVHHNPSFGGQTGGLKDSEALFQILRPRKQVKAYIYGHTHTWKVEQDPSGIHLVNLPPVAYVFREGEPAGWVHATAQRDGMRLELRCLDTAHKAHGQIENLKWRT